MHGHDRTPSRATILAALTTHSILATAVLTTAVFTTAGRGAAQIAATAVSPADRTTLEGSSFTHFPLGRPNARFQFLHADLPPGMVLHGHAFRRDATQVRGIVDAFAADLEVTLSISPNSPATASSTFANNIGSPTVVLPRTTLVFPATDRPPLDPAANFDLVVPYAVPFVMPAQPVTLCVDTVLYGNTSPAGVDRNLSIYLDSHEQLSNGTTEQPGYRTGTGCAPLTGGASATATMSLWHLGTSMRLDVAARNGVPDDGTGSAICLLGVGTSPANAPWPVRPQCVLQTLVSDVFVLGSNDLSGNFTGSLANQPVLPPGVRFYLQIGSAMINQPDLVVSDLTTLVTPGAAPGRIEAVRIAASTNRLATTGTIAASVPVTQFF